MRSIPRSRYGPIIACVCLATWSIVPPPATAANLGKLVRAAGRLSDDVPIGRLDDVASEIASSGAARRALKKAGVVTEDSLARGRAVRRLLGEAVGEVSPTILRQVDALDDVSREVALVLARGSRGVRRNIPDLALRGRFVRDGGAETLAALGLYDDLVEDAIRFDVAVRGGRLLAGTGGRRISLEEFGRFFRTTGDRGHRFWVACVRPHWKLWLGGTALAAVMLTPDDYLDAAGDLTKQGLEKIGRLGGTALAGALEGVVRVAGEAARGTAETIWAISPPGVREILALFAAILAGAALLRMLRRWSGILIDQLRPAVRQTPAPPSDGDREPQP